MSKWKEYGSFNKWQSQNENELKSDYDACEYERRQLFESPTFDDYCMGVWQRLD